MFVDHVQVYIFSRITQHWTLLGGQSLWYVLGAWYPAVAFDWLNSGCLFSKAVIAQLNKLFKYHSL